jgi:uncharacterized caspase-like protein
MIRIVRYLTFLATLACLAVFAPHAESAERVALVIGSNDYAHAPKLKNALNDARRIAGTLRAIGFDVIEAYDADQARFAEAMDAFAGKASGARIAAVYYAGHGIQYQGEVYLVPTDIDLTNERDLRKTVPANYLVGDAVKASDLGLVILDACRDNPFVRQIAEDLGPTRSTAVNRGLSLVQDAPTKALIAYSTQSGNVAIDGTGENSPFAVALAENLAAPNKDVRLIFGSVRDSVVAATDGKQEPYIYGSLGGNEIFLSTSTKSAAAPAESARLEMPVAATSAALADSYVAWSKVLKAEDWLAADALVASEPQSLFAAVTGLVSADRSTYSRPADALAASSGQPVAVKGLDKTAVMAIQTALRSLDYLSTGGDGVAGPKTVRALAAFAEAEASGAVTVDTLVRLAERSVARPSASPLTGAWSGRYEYPDGREGVDFTQQLTVSQGLVTGFISEPNTFGDATSKNLYATFSGMIDGNEIAWTKTYDGTAGVSHSVIYQGILDRKGRTITGEWSVPGSWKGPFRLSLQ